MFRRVHFSTLHSYIHEVLQEDNVVNITVFASRVSLVLAERVNGFSCARLSYTIVLAPKA